jgi:hypothetical protein
VGKPKKATRIEVTWLDSCSADGVHYWQPMSDLRTDPLTITTRGFLLKETKKAVVIAASIADGGAPGGVLTIPKIAITGRTEV